MASFQYTSSVIFISQLQPKNIFCLEKLFNCLKETLKQQTPHTQIPGEKKKGEKKIYLFRCSQLADISHLQLINNPSSGQAWLGHVPAWAWHAVEEKDMIWLLSGPLVHFHPLLLQTSDFNQGQQQDAAYGEHEHLWHSSPKCRRSSS